MRHGSAEVGFGGVGPGVEVDVCAAFESCSAVRKDPTPPQMGQRFFGGSFGGRGPGGQSYIHAIDIHTGAKVWEYPLVGGGFGGTGMLATAGKLVFFGESGGRLRQWT